MILVGSALKGFTIEASDGRIGTVADFLFDDRTWKIRWMVVDTGDWISGQKTLVHPSALGKPDYQRKAMSVRLTSQQVKDSPGITSDEPVSRQMQARLYGHHGWDPLWGGSNYFGGYASGMGGAFDPVPYRYDSGQLEADRAATGGDDGDPHLRSVTAVLGYHIQATDGPIGHVETLLVDESGWGIRYLIIDTRNWWPGQHVLLSPYAVRAISWSDRDVTVDVTRDKIKGSPIWDSTAMPDRGDERRLHDYYGWPGYGW
jgi:hypothetical protein